MVLKFSLPPPRGPIPLVKGKCPEGTKGIGKVPPQGADEGGYRQCGGHRGRTSVSARRWRMHPRGPPHPSRLRRATFPPPGGRWHGEAMTDEGECRGCGGHRGPTQYPQGVCRIRKAPSSPTAAQRSAPTRAIVTRRRGGPPCPPVENGCTPAGPPHPPLRGTFPPAWGRLISFMTVPQGAGKATRPCWSFSVVPYYRNRGETEVSM